MTFAARVGLVVSVTGLLHPWILYPLWLRIRARRWSLITMARDHRVSVSIIIPAFNKEAEIPGKLRNTLALDYPGELMEVLVIADGCTDGTEAAVRRVRDPRVRLISLPRGGRLASLQQTVLRAKGEILVFTDANVRLRAGALRRLVRNFADWHVGGVCGMVRPRRRRNADAFAVGESLFARYDAMVRGLEGRLGSVHAADSALYAIRRGLFQAPRNLAQADAMAISMRVVLAGKRLVFEPDAVCFRDVAADGAREMMRRRNSINYAIRSILDVRWLLLRRQGYAVQLLSHTVARYLTGIWALSATLSAAMLVLAADWSPWLLVPPGAFLSLAATGWLLRRRLAGRFFLFSLPLWLAAASRAWMLGGLGTLAGLRPVGARPRQVGSRSPVSRVPA